MRRITSLILVISFVILAASGVQMAAGSKPSNFNHAAVGQQDGGAPKREMPLYPKKAHEWAGYLFIGAGLVHMVLNRRLMISYLKGQ